MKLKNLWTKTLVILTALFAVQAFASDTPYSLTQKVSDKLFATIADNQSKIKQDPNYLKTIVRQQLMPYAHVKYAGSQILGNYFKTIPVEEREQFFAVLDKYIEQVYAQVLTLYTNQKLEVVKPQDPNSIVTLVKVLQGNQAPINVNFYWYKNSKTGQWQVYDMSANGAGMVDAKRKEWSPYFRKPNGMKELIKELEKVANQSITLGK